MHLLRIQQVIEFLPLLRGLSPDLNSIASTLGNEVRRKIMSINILNFFYTTGYTIIGPSSNQRVSCFKIPICENIGIG